MEIPDILTSYSDEELLARFCRGQTEAFGVLLRRYERELRKIMVDKCGMPQEHFVKTFPPNALNLSWAEREISTGRHYSIVMNRNLPAIQELQQAMMAVGQAAYGDGNGHAGPDGQGSTPTPEGAVEGEYREV